ncbi:MAG TPA: NADH-quinone oxidoreductase subunit NuoG [Nitrospira sp.]|nr:NADH-quinone oxidoreductase subunit NuoG [Nitrospira sp.]
MAGIIVDDRPYQVDERENLLQACLSLGFNLPYFCWHPALGSVGACRQCAVKQFRNEQDRQGHLVMACMTPAADGTRISIEDPEAKTFRASVIEWMMANHPHDCPVCDEGGECHLQDMTVMTGHAYRRFRFNKRTFRNQDLGPFITHEMNRCIQCYRCVRLYRDYAGGRDFDAFGSRNHVYFGRHEDGTLENEFSGNLVEVCPTGVFDDKTLMPHYTRKWDLQTAPSVCAHCSLGCNTIAGERYGTLRRILNRYHNEVNGYFLCDRGRFGYGFVNSEERIRRPKSRPSRDGQTIPIDKDMILRELGPLLADKPSRIIGIGSPRASLESNFALRELVGPERFSLGLSVRDAGLNSIILDILRRGPAPSASIHDVEQADAVLILGEDLINTAPRLALAVRQSARQQPMEIVDKLGIPRWHDAAVREAAHARFGPLFIAAPYSSWFADIATETYHAAPDDLARLGFVVAHELDQAAPTASTVNPTIGSLAKRIAAVLGQAERPLVISGTACKSEAVIQSAANVAWALCKTGTPAKLCYCLPESNSLGLAMLGGKSLEEAFSIVKNGAADTVLILENDLYRRADALSGDAFLKTASKVIILDTLEHDTTAKADVLLPAGTFAESDGTLVNNEGRAQRFYQVFPAEADIQESWRWIRDLAVASGHPAQPNMTAWNTLDDVVLALSEAIPVFRRLAEAAPPEKFRMIGQKIPRQTHRFTGRTSMHAPLLMHEPKPVKDPDSPLAFSMEGYLGQPPSPLITHYWAPGWNSVQALNKFQSEVGGPLRQENPGVRLIESFGKRTVTYFTDAPKPFQALDHGWLILPWYQIFGTDELSARASAMAERIPGPTLMLHPEDAATLRFKAGERTELMLGNRSHRVPVKLDAAVPRGTAALTIVSDFTDAVLPAWSPLIRVAEP